MIITDIILREGLRDDGMAAVDVRLALDGPLTGDEDLLLLAAIDAVMNSRKAARVADLVSKIQDLPDDDKAAVLSGGAKPKPVQEPLEVVP